MVEDLSSFSRGKLDSDRARRNTLEVELMGKEMVSPIARPGGGTQNIPAWSCDRPPRRPSGSSRASTRLLLSGFFPFLPSRLEQGCRCHVIEHGCSSATSFFGGASSTIPLLACTPPRPRHDPKARSHHNRGHLLQRHGQRGANQGGPVSCGSAHSRRHPSTRVV